MALRVLVSHHRVFFAAVTALYLGMTATIASAAPIKILALGDSLTSGYGLPPGEGFTDQLGQALKDQGMKATVINGGVAGDTTADGLSRLDWSLADDPTVVIVELGGNDALRGLDPVVTKKNLDKILTKLQQQHRGILLAGMLAPPNLGSDYSASFNPIFPDLAKQHDVTLYPFFLDGVAGNPTLVQPDGIHPTAQGVAIIVQRILPSLHEAIDKVRDTD